MWVYVHIFPNGKKYVGKTVSPLKTRWGKNGNGYKKQLVGKAIQKFGWENVQHIAFDVDTQGEMNYLEKYLIGFYNTRNKRFGYNVSEGGEIEGSLLSDETKQKLSDYHKGKESPFKGKTQSETAKEANRSAHLGRKHSEATRKKQSCSMKGKNSKSVIRTSQDGTTVEYESITLAAKENGISLASLQRHLDGIIYKEYYWYYGMK